MTVSARDPPLTIAARSMVELSTPVGNWILLGKR
jgi:hypothetical protein